MSLVRDMDDWYATEAPDDVVLMSVAVDLETGEEAQSFVDAYSLTSMIFADPGEVWLDAWGDRGSQHTYTIIDSTGHVAWHKTGTTSRAGLTYNLEDVQ